MNTIIYREGRKSDFTSIKKLINESFYLYRYVDGKDVLESWLNAYLQSCLAEQTFTSVAEKDGVVVGVIMGKSNSAFNVCTHLPYIFAMGYHSAVMHLKAWTRKEDIKANGQIHQTYHELRTECGQKFDGVLTLFAVTSDCRGFGIGKELLNRLLCYQREHHTTNLYLYTDSTCNYGFYERQGFARLGERKITVASQHIPTELEIYLYGLVIHS